MKHHLLLFIMVFLFPFMACGDDELKEIYNPNLLRSTSIDDSPTFGFSCHCGE